MDVRVKKVDGAFSSARFFYSKPVGLRKVRSRLTAPVGAPASPGRPQDDRALSWTLDKKVDEAFRAPSAFFYSKPVGLRMVRSRLTAPVGAPAPPGRPQDDRALS